MSGTGRRPRISPTMAGIIAGVFIALVVGLMAKINIDFSAPWATTHTVTAEVTDADGIGVSSDVRIAGRLVGQVTQVQSKGAYSEVTFHVDDADWPLPADSTASIRLATLLGQKYVEIQPGKDTGHHLADNAVLTTSKTKDVVDFDQILNTFDKPTRDALTGLIRTVGAGVRGQEGTLQQLLPSLRDLSVHSQVPTNELAVRDPELNSILVNLGTTADRLDQSRDDLAGVIDNLNHVTGTLAANQGALRGYIRNVDTINRTTQQVLGGGGAAQLEAGLSRLGATATMGDKLITTMVPDTAAFSHTALRSAIALIYEIGDATSQSDHYGYFLRQNLEGIDLSGMFPNGIPGVPSANGSTVPTPTLPLPGVTLPPLPPLPSLPPLPVLPTPSPGGNGSTPTPLPLPIPTPSFPAQTGYTPTAGFDAWFASDVLGGGS